MAFLTQTIGFLGCGNMAECIMAGFIKEGSLSPQKIYVCNRTMTTVTRLCDTYKVNFASPTELVTKCDIIFIGVKPFGVTALLEDIKQEVSQEKIIVSMAAGVTIAVMELHLPLSTKIIRVMPNVSVSVGCGVTSVSPNKASTADDTALITKLFGLLGKVTVVAESTIPAIIGLCGSSPAYIFMFIETLSDAAVWGGIPRAESYDLAAQAVMGAAKMIHDSGKNPAALKDMVCSPGGTTIEAVRYLEKGGLRSTVFEAVIQCIEKSKSMEEKKT